MKDRRKRDVLSWNQFFCGTLYVILGCIFLAGFFFSTNRLFAGEAFLPVPVKLRRPPAIDSISDDSPAIPPITIRETVLFPDQAVVFLNYPPFSPLFTEENLDCIYSFPNSSEPESKLPPLRLDGQIIRCPLKQRGLIVSVGVKSSGYYHDVSPGPTYNWDSISYDAVIDRDNTTVVFVKGLNLRRERVSDPTRFECVYGWDFNMERLILKYDVVSLAQEIVRCKTPLSVLSKANGNNQSIKVSIRYKGRGGGIIRSMARPSLRLEPNSGVTKEHEICVCTMLRNQARFLREWVIYHARIGVERWFVYDNNSDDDIDEMIESLDGANFNISRHVWPWIKTQEAGFAHCALQARDKCKWVGFIDVDEFFHLPTGLMLRDIIRNQSMPNNVGELRVRCHNFGPSGLKRAPLKGVTIGYTCRLRSSERHKSLVRPEALSPTLINVVHHFQLMSGFESRNVDSGVMVINHYKYQVWEVFKDKFYRRVATYVTDWQAEEGIGSKDRAPGLGTQVVEPPDWSDRFCEVRDRGLKFRVIELFDYSKNLRFPWQSEDAELGSEEELVEHKIARRKRKGKRKHMD